MKHAGIQILLIRQNDFLLGHMAPDPFISHR
jgi:hypothetical protein